MPEVRCLDDAQLLSAASGEELPVVLASHVADCDSCRRRLQHVQTQVAALRGTVAHGDSLPPKSPHPPAPGPAPDAGLPAGPPPMVGKYPVVSELARSGQAVVYRAIHPGLSTEVVVKLAHRPAGRDGQERHRLVAEAQILARLEHPNLARVFDLDFHDHRPFLVLEYVRGWSLGEQRRRQGRPQPRHLARWLAQAARGLGAAHAAGILHRDIKPDNIVLDESGRPRVLDFGMALWGGTWGDDGEQRTGVCGTPAYMPPEQARGDHHRVGPRSDVFGLGAVLYQQLTGQGPFSGPSSTASQQRARDCDYDIRALDQRDIPRGLAAICRRALAADPADRYATAEDLAVALERYANRGRTLALRAAALVLVLLLAGAAVVFWPAGSSPAREPLQYLVRVHRDGAPALVNDAIPVTHRDRGRIVCEVPNDVQFAVFWRDQLGRLTELDPRRIQVSPAGSGQRLVYPDQGTFQLDSLPGTEFVFVCGSRTRRPENGTVAAALGSLLDPGKNPKLPGHAMIVMTRDRLEVISRSPEETLRGHQLVGADSISRAEDRFDNVRRAFRDQYDFFVGVAFPHE